MNLFLVSPPSAGVTRLRSATAAALLVPTALTVIAALSLAACGKSNGATPAAAANGSGNGGGGRERVLVRIEEVRQEPMAAVYSTSATLRAAQRATVTARTRGVIEALRVEEGMRVGAGQEMAVLENDEQEIAHQRAVTRRDQLRRDFERTQSLAAQGLLSEGELETATRDLADAEQAAALTALELSRTRLDAPFAGVVLTRLLDVGATVADGTAVYEIAATDTLYADVNVPERHVARLAVDQPVRVVADATSEEIDATIERIAPAVDPATGTVKVTLAMPGSSRSDGPGRAATAAGRGSSRRPGTFVRADIVTDERADALVVPRSALVAEGRRWFVYRAVDERPASAKPLGGGPGGPGGPAAGAPGATGRQGADGKGPGAAPPPPPSPPFAEKVEVAVGFEDGDRVEVRAAHDDPAAATIAAGDRVVVAGAGALSNGATITIETDTAVAATPAEGADTAAGGQS